MLQVERIEVSIGRRRIVRGVSFEAAAGEWFGLLGANGSGKTTILRALNGRLVIDAGEVRLAGQGIGRDLEALATRIGFAPPPDSLPEELTAGELLTLVGRARRADPRAPAALYRALDVAWLQDQPIGAMSAGMRQRVCLFTAFVGEPEAVLLDEPFNWLDPVAAYDLKAALRGWVDAGGALVTAVHDIAAFATRCERGLLLHDGAVVKTFDPAEMAAGRTDILRFEDTVYEAFKAAAHPAA
ncbi:MAG TPA: ATP-binding cassette domain-containing protein [Caulobacteraceae bacterium]|nr:ATP-binding cassette domain-containing protein [Caulobacteraceae bacterium]